MNGLTNQPTIYEIDTPVFLYELEKKLDRPVTLATVPDEVWDDLALLHVDAVWFMGVWKRSDTARKMALGERWLRKELPEVKDKEIIGSAYSIQEYVVDEALGGDKALATARKELKKRGMGLILDYVPNHVAIDHGWATEHPDYLLQGTADELRLHPKAFVMRSGTVFANAKDPTFPPWSDVLQLNAFSPELRFVTSELLKRIAGMCDGVRCDMAMLMINDVFKKTWGSRVGDVPSEEFWPGLIAAAKEINPSFIFMAEVYWGREQELLNQGFDLCYDKELYDHLLKGSADDIRTHLQRPVGYQQHLLRFIENHDEPRAAKEFSFHKHAAAAVVMATLPGAHLYYEGQLEGRRIKLPVHVKYRPSEPLNKAINRFYLGLLSFVHEKGIPGSRWAPLSLKKRLFGWYAHQILAWSWEGDKGQFVVCINYSHEKVTARAPFLDGVKVSAVYDVVKGEEANDVLRLSTVRLDAWQCVVIELKDKVNEAVLL